MNRKGQAHIELALSAAMVSLAIVGAGWVLKAQWERSKCAYLVFETTHARVAGHPLPPASIRVILSEDEQAVEGSALCGQASESIRLPKLEHAQW